MAFAGGAISAALSALWEHKPDVPDFHWTDLVQQQLDTTAGNMGVLPKSEQLGAGVNDFMRGERNKTLAGIPGFDEIEGLQVDNLKNWLSGKLSPEAASQINRHSNAHAFGGGYGNSGMKADLEARDLGIGALQLQQNAMGQAGNYLGHEASLRAIPEFNPASMFINPMAAAQFNAQQEAAKLQQQWLKARIDAQPQPWQQSIMDSWEKGMSMADSIGSSYLGNMAGGKGGGGGMGGQAPTNPWAPGGAASNFYGLKDPIGYGANMGAGSFSDGGGSFYGM